MMHREHEEIGIKIAVIDIGTNALKLMIGKLTRVIYTIICDLSEEITPNKNEFEIFTEETKQNILNIMTSFKAIVDSHNVDYIKAKATSSLRAVPNISEMLKDIHDQTDITIDVISGEEEADLIHRGVSTAVKLGKHNALMMDIGGGSVEFIICNAYQKLWKKSFEIGSNRIMDKFYYHDPILVNELRIIETYYWGYLQELFDVIKQYQPVQLIGSSGAFRTLRQLHAVTVSIPYENIQPFYSLSKQDVLNLYQDIITKSTQEWLSLPNVSQIGEKYLRLIVASSTLVLLIMNQMGANSIEISNFSLRMGIFFDTWEMMKRKGMEVIHMATLLFLIS